MSDKVLGLIPARGGSKGVPKKNVRELNGCPLIAYSIQAGLDAAAVDSVIVSTEDEEIRQVADSYEARVPFVRPPELATDSAPTEPVIMHALESLLNSGEDYDAIVLLQPTSPLRTAAHIDEAYSTYKSSCCDSVISVYPTRDTRWRQTPNGAIQLNYQDSPNPRQERSPEYVMNGAIFITSVDQFLRAGEIVTGTVELYEMREERSVDIDTMFDLWLAETIMSEWIDND